MGEIKALVRTYVQQGLRVNQALELAGISRNHYYQKPKQGEIRPVGRPVSTHTQKYSEDDKIELVDNEQVIDQIGVVLEDPDTQYGYKRMTAALMLAGYIIGSKKVYRLMKENGLLQRRFRPSGRSRVRGRRVDPSRPLEILTMDIKQVWIEEFSRSAYILTILDTFTRTTLYRCEGYQMTQHQVKQAWQQVIVEYLQPADLLTKGLQVQIRNDNGPQFAAKLVQEFLKENGLSQVFTYPYCPEQNGHIESFHAILAQHLDRYHFLSLADLTLVLDRFYHKYNNIRLHGSIACLPPKLFWNLWEEGLVTKTYTPKNRVKFKIKMPYWKLSGNGHLREFPFPNQARRA